MKKQENKFNQFQFDKLFEMEKTKTSVWDVISRFPKEDTFFVRIFKKLFSNSITKYRAKKLKKSFDYINKQLDSAVLSKNNDEIINIFKIEYIKMNKKTLSLDEFNKKDENKAKKELLNE